MAVSRRRLLALGGLLAAAPALAQAPKLRRIGILVNGSQQSQGARFEVMQ